MLAASMQVQHEPVDHLQVSLDMGDISSASRRIELESGQQYVTVSVRLGHDQRALTSNRSTNYGSVLQLRLAVARTQRFYAKHGGCLLLVDTATQWFLNEVQAVPCGRQHVDEFDFQQTLAACSQPRLPYLQHTEILS